jgi:hypothetical protein
MAFDLVSDWVDREVACFVVAAIMVTAGTIGTGVLPATLPFQLLAGGLILAAFALIVVCLKDEESGVDPDR